MCVPLLGPWIHNTPKNTFVIYINLDPGLQDKYRALCSDKVSSLFGGMGESFTFTLGQSVELLGVSPSCFFAQCLLVQSLDRCNTEDGQHSRCWWVSGTEATAPCGPINYGVL